MTTAQKREALPELSRVVDQVDELRGRVLAAADDVALDDGARDAAAWVAHQTRTRVGPRRSLRLGQAPDRWLLVGAGVREDTVNREQADVTTHALDQLPTDPDTRATAGARLVAEAAHFEAAHFGPRHLRVTGRRILDIADLTLLCTCHHHRTYDDTTHHPAGEITFHRRT